MAMTKEERVKYNHDWYIKDKEANPEKYKEQSRRACKKYREKHPSQLRARCKEWREKHPEENKILLKEWKSKHRVEQSNYERERRRANKDKINKRTKELRKMHPEKFRNLFLKSEYGITLDDYNIMYNMQHERCAICGIHQSNAPKRFIVDHDHGTGKVRGLLCYRCNTALGCVHDRVDILRKAIIFLEESDGHN